MVSGAYELKKKSILSPKCISVCQQFFGLKLYITIQCLQQIFLYFLKYLRNNLEGTLDNHHHRITQLPRPKMISIFR